MLKVWYRILVPDFPQLIPANTNRSAALLENPTDCKRNVYFWFGLTALNTFEIHRKTVSQACCNVRFSLNFILRVGGRVVRWCWVNFQCRGVLQFGLQ